MDGIRRSLDRLRTHGYTQHLAAADHRLILDQAGSCRFATEGGGAVLFSY